MSTGRLHARRRTRRYLPRRASTARIPQGVLTGRFFAGCIYAALIGVLLASASGPAAASGRRVALFGDSNSAFVLQDVDPRHLSNYGYFNWINRVLGAPFDLVFDAGVPGNDTRQMRARYERDVVARASDYDVVFLLAGVNDVRHGLSPAETAENLRFFAEDQERRGKFVVLTLPQPVGWANPIVTAGMLPSTEEARSRYAELRRLTLAWTSTLAATRRIIACDPYATLVDPGSSQGDMNARLSPDQIHFAAPAGLRYAQAIRDTLAARLLPV